jgi:hypothetical protein
MLARPQRACGFSSSGHSCAYVCKVSTADAGPSRSCTDFTEHPAAIGKLA